MESEEGSSPTRRKRALPSESNSDYQLYKKIKVEEVDDSNMPPPEEPEVIEVEVIVDQYDVEIKTETSDAMMMSQDTPSTQEEQVAVKRWRWPPAPIPAERFYRPHPPDVQVRLNLLQKMAQSLKQKKTLKHIFPKQDLAFKFADETNSTSTNNPVRVFSFERQHFSGAPHLTRVIGNRPPNERHFYEVIREGYPCCLYFDIEFLKSANESLNGDEVLSQFIAFLIEDLKEEFNLEITLKDIIDLDSTSTTKFSRHLIVRPCVFASNIDMGYYVRHLHMKAIRKWQQSKGTEYNSFFPKNKQGDRTFIADHAVYSRNRNFRLYLSSKLGSTTPLSLAKSCEYSYSSQTQLFMDSLVCNVNIPEEKLLHYLPQWNPIDLKLLNRSTALKIDSGIETVQNSYVNHANTSEQVIKSSTHTQPSPFPEVDEFIANKLRKRPGSSGYIRSWIFYPQSFLIVYSIGGNRYCENIGREHKSNHIMIAADLSKCIYYQKCQDPECRSIGFKGTPHVIPLHVVCPLFLLEDWNTPTELEESKASQNSASSIEELIRMDDSLLKDEELLQIDLDELVKR